MVRKKSPKRRKTRRTTKYTSKNPVLFFDIVGVGLIVLCPIMLIALLAEHSSGFVGHYLAPWIRDLVGVGALAIPFVPLILGAMMIVGPLRIIPRSIWAGSSTLYLSVLAWASLAARIHNISPEQDKGGGHVGNIIAGLLRSLFGNRISFWVLGGAAAIGVVILIDTPLASFIEKFGDAWRAWRDAAREHAEEVRANRAKDNIAKPKEPDAAAESRKRTLTSIFGRGNGEKAPVEEPIVAAQAVPVKINGPSPYKPLSTPSSAEPALDMGPGEAEYGEFVLPPTMLLAEPPPPPPRVESELRENIETIERTLQEFKVEASVVEIAHGPTVARYEIRLAPGIKVNKIVGLADNLAMQLAAIDVRVEAPIPGKAAIGVEVPNRNRSVVVLREVVESKALRESPSKLSFALGKDVAGKSVIADLARMPHMLIGGATNAGKSVCLNSLIASLLFRVTPDELKFILIDPKRVELSLFDGIPHLACPVVKDVKQAAGVLRAVVQEMDHRYTLFARIPVRNIDGYNEKVGEAERMPYMVVVVDELADLMMQMAAEVEGSITRLAQLARATGIHLVIATQRPSVDVITGVIKANISSRIAFAVSSHHDSRTILDQKGAERLIGRGDMLFLPIDSNKPTRIQGCYISEKEIESLCDYLKDQRKPVYTIQPGQVPGTAGGGEADDGLADEFYEPSVRFVVNTGYCSTSMLQRKFKVGYTRAARIVDSMEQQGIVGALDGAKPRQVLITRADLEAILGGKLGLPFDEPEVVIVDDDDSEFIEEAPPAEEIRPDDKEEES